MTKGEQYTCDQCGRTYQKAVSDDEAMAECEAIFGKWPKESLAIICDDCWKQMLTKGAADEREV